MTPTEMTDQRLIEAEPPGSRKLARALMARLEERMCQKRVVTAGTGTLLGTGTKINP